MALHQQAAFGIAADFDAVETELTNAAPAMDEATKKMEAAKYSAAEQLGDGRMMEVSAMHIAGGNLAEFRQLTSMPLKDFIEIRYTYAIANYLK